MLDHLIALLEREMASIEHNVLNGSCSDYTTYREQVAMLATFKIAIDLAKRAFRDEEDEE